MGWLQKNQQINLSFFSYIAICFIWLEVCQFYEKKIHLVCWFSSYFDQPTSQGKALCGILYCGVIHAMKSAQHAKTKPTVSILNSQLVECFNCSYLSGIQVLVPENAKRY